VKKLQVFIHKYGNVSL